MSRKIELKVRKRWQLILLFPFLLAGWMIGWALFVQGTHDNSRPGKTKVSARVEIPEKVSS
jgi:hypothetical protein